MFPQLKKLKEVYGPKGFEILGVAIDEPETLAQYFKEHGDLPWPNIVDAGGVISKKSKVDYPVYLLIDETGKHIASPWDKEKLGDQIADALGVEAIAIDK